MTGITEFVSNAFETKGAIFDAKAIPGRATEKAIKPISGEFFINSTLSPHIRPDKVRLPRGRLQKLRSVLQGFPRKVGSPEHPRDLFLPVLLREFDDGGLGPRA